MYDINFKNSREILTKHNTSLNKKKALSLAFNLQYFLSAQYDGQIQISFQYLVIKNLLYAFVFFFCFVFWFFKLKIICEQIKICQIKKFKIKNYSLNKKKRHQKNNKK